MKYKKVKFFFMVLLCLLFVYSVYANSPPARIGGLITVDGSVLTQATFSGYSVVVKKQDSSSYQPAAQCTSLNTSDWYLIDIPIYHATLNPEGATSGDTAKIHLFYNGQELIINNPSNGQLIVGQSGSATHMDITAMTNQTINSGPAAGTTIFSSKGFFSVPPTNIDIPASSPAVFPFGIIDFTISDVPPGEEITVTFTTPDPIPTNCVYYKYQNDEFYIYSRVSGLDDGDNTFTITLADGEKGDDDGLVNGIISDPGGPGLPNSRKAFSIPTLTQWGIIFFFLILSGIGHIKIYRYRENN